MKRTILLAGPSAAGKSTLARALAIAMERKVVSTSTHLRSITGLTESGVLFEAGARLDRDNPIWLAQLSDVFGNPVVDAVRSFEQHNSFGDSEVVRVNVVADMDAINFRHAQRGTRPVPTPFMFNRPDFCWNSSRMSVATAVTAIGQLAGAGSVDLLVGGQFGSEGKGKLAAILAPGYDLLVRSGGPNAGHWVRNDDFEYCYHHLPSGTRSNFKAQVCIAAGATVWPERFWEEVRECGAGARLWVDRNVVLIEDADREQEGRLISMVGSTAQGVGMATSRRIMRGLQGQVRTADDVPEFRPHVRDVSHALAVALGAGRHVMVEGTQGSMLSMFHGEYPFTTSRDTNASGLLSEVGLPACHVRDTWMVVRSFPIRVGGNSGPMVGELDWGVIADRIGVDRDALQKQELTSTTKRQRRVAEFNWPQFHRAVSINRPTRLFLTFGDYIDPKAAGIRDYGKLPDSVLKFCDRMEQQAGCPVAGVSTGRSQDDTCMRYGYVR